MLIYVVREVLFLLIDCREVLVSFGLGTRYNPIDIKMKYFNIQ